MRRLIAGAIAIGALLVLLSTMQYDSETRGAFASGQYASVTLDDALAARRADLQTVLFTECAATIVAASAALIAVWPRRSNAVATRTAPPRQHLARQRTPSRRTR